MLGQRQAESLIERVLSASGAGETGVSVVAHDSALTRYANSTIHQNVAERDVAVAPGFFFSGPQATNLVLAPGDASLDEMIRSTTRGLFITSFWYTRLVHPRDCIVTGMTRDGASMIENGELTYAVKNLRFTQSYLHAMAAVQAVGRDLRTVPADFGYAIRVPALKIERFTFTGVTV